MQEFNTLVATERTEFGKGASRQLRRDGKTPVVVYGHGTDTLHLAVESHPLSLIVRRANALIELDLGDKKKQLVLVRDVQKDPVLQVIEHADLVIIRTGETVLVEVHVVMVGEAFSGSNALLELGTLALHVPATNIPQNIEIDVEGLEAGTQILVKDIVLPEGAVAEDDPEQLVVHVVEQKEAPEPSESDANAEVASDTGNSAE